MVAASSGWMDGRTDGHEIDEFTAIGISRYLSDEDGCASRDIILNWIR
jgi:hypothetical protein